MFNANMPSLSDIAAVTGNDRDGGWGGNGWWIIIILLAMWGGFGGYGWGANSGYGNGGGYVATAATQADIQRGFDTQNIISKLDGINYGMCDGFYAVNNANNVAAMQNTNALQTQLSDCCCQNKQGQAQIQYDMATNTCAITNAIAQQTQAIMQNDNANYRQLHDEIVANQIAAKDDTIAQLRSRLAAADLAASQQAQNAYLVNQLRPPVNPAYVVTNPYAGTGTLPCQTAGCCGVSA